MSPVLTDAAIRNAKPAAKPLRLFAGGGLYLEVAPLGASGGNSSIVLGARKNGSLLACTQKFH